MSDAVIAAVEARAEAEGQPLIVGGCPIFEWRSNVLIEDEPHIGDHVVDTDNLDASVGEQQMDEELIPNNEIEEELFEDDNDIDGIDAHLSDEGQSVTDDGNVSDDDSEDLVVQEVDTTTTSEEEDHVSDTMNMQQENATIGNQKILGRYNLRANRHRDYSHRFDHQVDNLTTPTHDL